MIGDFERYAVYWVPGRSDGLSRFGASWMGWCAEMGEMHPRTSGAGPSAEICGCTREISRHGFHGVIRAPFRLATGRSRWSIEHALQVVAEDVMAFAMPRFELAVIDGRVALAPVLSDATACARLADATAIVAEAIGPLTDSDHPADDLIARQGRSDGERLRQLPARGAHRFHLPLTDRPDLSTAFRIMEELRPWLEPLLEERRQFSDLALMGDPGGGRPLRILQRFELRDTPVRQGSSALPCSGRQTLIFTPDDPAMEPGIAI